MSSFQLLAVQINIGGDRNTVIHRSRFEPVTYPEYLLLQVIHGGAEHVHHAMSTGYVERDPAEEHARLTEKYGEPIMQQVFPGASLMLPLANDALPSEEEVLAGENASANARARVRAKKRPTEGMVLPGLADQTPEMPGAA